MDVEALQESARLFEGEHDFLSFAATDPDLASRASTPDGESDQRTKALPAPEKLDPEGGGGFNLRITPTESMRALAPEGRFLSAEKDAVRTIFSSTWEHQGTLAGELLVYRVRGNGFLHHMVRNLVGTMLDVGRGHLHAEEIPGIIAARSRSAAGPTAPARGLFLHSVEYDGRDAICKPK
jgi:tRNA pseudouridine38-40 synthase